jgi:hypothetical protein
VAIVVARGQLDRGAVIGLLTGVVCEVVLVLCSETQIMAQPPRSYAGRLIGRQSRRREVLLLVLAAAVLLPWSWSWADTWLPALMIPVGMIVFYPAAAALSYWFLPHAARFAMRAGRMPDPWSPRFLTFAADRSLLVRAGGGYRFPHRLVRLFLASSHTDDLAADVHRRRRPGD